MFCVFCVWIKDLHRLEVDREHALSFSSVSLNLEPELSSVRICTVELELGLHLTVN